MDASHEGANFSLLVFQLGYCLDFGMNRLAIIGLISKCFILFMVEFCRGNTNYEKLRICAQIRALEGIET